MSVLLREIRRFDAEAASTLEKAGLHTDSELQSLTREDLHELFPQIGKLKLRKKIYEIIHQQKDINVLLREMKYFIPDDSFRAALTNNGILVDYLRILKEMKTQMNTVQTFLDAHIDLLEEFAKNQHQEPHNGSLADTKTPGRSGIVVPCSRQTEGLPQQAQDRHFAGTHTSQGDGPMMPYTNQTNQQGAQSTHISQGHSQMPYKGQTNPQGLQAYTTVSKVMYRTVISGRTFGAHTQLLHKVKDEDQFLLIENNEDCKVIIVFCTISSRVGTDVEAVMSDIKGDEPVILVLMHHTREAKNTVPKKTWPEYPKIELAVNTFFHDTIPGLLNCQQNNEAALKIKNKLLEYRIQERKDISGNALAVGGDAGVTASATHGGARKVPSFNPQNQDSSTGSGVGDIYSDNGWTSRFKKQFNW